ncbi:hypothetical protein [Streptomyces catenulae]|uniref:Uncharacterized protein n=1 Tax=Streptomyces catenulae TaxID=66875 RepID=A0ABV2Z2F1_9ACTN|nr:hypothetical protein [Streptomyces catenulae]
MRPVLAEPQDVLGRVRGDLDQVLGIDLPPLLLRDRCTVLENERDRALQELKASDVEEVQQ